MMNKDDFGKYNDFAQEVLEYMKLTAGALGIDLTPEYVNNVLECAININCLDNDVDMVKEYQSCAIAAMLASSLFKGMMKDGDNE